MICPQNFEIRTVLLRRRPSWKRYLRYLSDSQCRFSRDNSSRLGNSTPKSYFSFPELLKSSSTWNITWKDNARFILHDFAKKQSCEPNLSLKKIAVILGGIPFTVNLVLNLGLGKICHIIGDFLSTRFHSFLIWLNY